MKVWNTVPWQSCWNEMMKCRFSVVVEKESDGYFSFYPELQGCYSGRCLRNLENIRDAICLQVKDRLECGEEIVQLESISLTSLEVAV
jgi:hypothetical protein